MLNLVARRFVEERGAARSLNDIRAAHKELCAECDRNDALRHASRLPKGEYSWLKTWWEEYIPAEVYCRHVAYDEQSLIALTPLNAPGADVVITSHDQVEQLELTIADAAMHENWDAPGSTSPGAQEALRMEMLNTEGHVSSDDPLVRNKRSGKVEYAENRMMRSSESAIPEWVNGIGLSLRKKRDKQRADPAYGQASILAVYASGLSGTFIEPPSKIEIDHILTRINADDIPTGFVRTVVFSWHPGWYRRIDANE